MMEEKKFEKDVIKLIIERFNDFSIQKINVVDSNFFHGVVDLFQEKYNVMNTSDVKVWEKFLSEMSLKEKKEHPMAHKMYSIYGNLPIPIRKEIVAVVDGEPMSWNIVKLELENKTRMGHEALDRMIAMELIK